MTSATTTPTNELLLDTLQAMRMQEVNAYRISTSHLVEIVQDDRSQEEKKTEDGDDSIIFKDKILSVYLSWRSEMVRWSYSIAQVCHFQKETVEITISIMDRYVAVDSEILLLDAWQYQLACMACMYTASKVHESQCLTPQQMEHLSRGRFTRQQIVQKEAQILKAIQWRVNPPTAIAFVRCLVESLPQAYNLPDNRTTILEVVEAQIELALADPMFIPVKASSLALAALMNAVQNVLQHSHLSFYWYTFTEALLMNQETVEAKIETLQMRLSLGLGSLRGADIQIASSSRSTKQPETILKRTSETLHERSPRSVVSNKRYSTQ
jgi:hypothetical protein